jgi:hydroxymethylpyrimidine/phosphomethylpyrimidine kinase
MAIPSERPLRMPRILAIAGSDSSGGAGIQADIKTATALGAYAMTAITAVTAQDTTGVYAVELMPPELVAAQIVACLDDIGADAIKIGMLGSGEIAAAVSDTLCDVAQSIPIVLDPVLVSTSGTSLLDEAGTKVLFEKLIPLAALVTPNIPEAEALTAIGCRNADAMRRAGVALIAAGANAALVKGGHGADDVLIDMLVTPRGHEAFSSPRIDTPHTHGTGCTYATAIAVGLAEGRSMSDAITRAMHFLHSAIATAPGFGRGHGPLNHMHGAKK